MLTAHSRTQLCMNVIYIYETINTTVLIQKLCDIFDLFLLHMQIDMQSNGSPLNNSPSTAGGNIGPSYASTVKAGTSDDDQ